MELHFAVRQRADLLAVFTNLEISITAGLAVVKRRVWLIASGPKRSAKRT